MEKYIENLSGKRWDNPDMDVVRSVIEEVKHRNSRFAGFSVVLILDRVNFNCLDVDLNMDKEILLSVTFDFGGDHETRFKAKSSDWADVTDLIKAFLDNDMAEVKGRFSAHRHDVPTDPKSGRGL